MKKIKYLFILLFIILIVVGSLVVIKYNNEQKEKKKLSYKEEITIKIGDKLPNINDYVDKKDQDKIKNTSIDWKDITIEENTTYYSGTYQGIFKFNDKKIIVRLNVIDDIKPSIEGVKDITIYEKEDIDLLKNIKTNDNSKDKIDIKVEGTYDINKKGEYKLKYVATDKSNNKEEKEFKLIVKEKVIKNNNITNKNTNSSVTRNIGTSSKGYKIEQKNGIYYVDGILIANKTYNLPSSYNPGGLLNTFTSNFNKMKNDASKEGVNLKIISGFRSYGSQSSIYNNYVRRDGKTKADTYSARAGHSEHQTGLAADINSLYQSFINTKEGKWLNDNCHKYGFIIRYPTGKEIITGYMYEPWHIRYVGVDMATKLYNNGNWISLEEYLGITSKY